MDTDISIVSFISAVEQHRKKFRQVTKNKLKNVCRATHLTGGSEVRKIVFIMMFNVFFANFSSFS